MPEDGGREREQWTLVKLGPINLRLNNFQWRKHALAHHDLHHLLTGYPCTLAGELQIAAWEFAAGRFPHIFSTLFCLPLVGIGTITMPIRSFDAFVVGRRSKTLYATPLTNTLLSLELQELCKLILPLSKPTAKISDVIAYLGLSGLSIMLISIPPLILLLFLPSFEKGF